MEVSPKNILRGLLESEKNQHHNYNVSNAIWQLSPYNGDDIDYAGLDLSFTKL